MDGAAAVASRTTTFASLHTKHHYEQKESLLDADTDTAHSADHDNGADAIDPATIHYHIFPLLPNSFDERLAIDGWQPLMHQSSAGTITLTKDTDLPRARARTGNPRYERVVEIVCHAGKPRGIAFTFPSEHQFIGTPLPIVNFQLKSLAQYLSITIDVEDVNGQRRTFSLTNAATIVRLGDSHCQLNLALVEGWNKFHCNLASLTKKIFHVEYAHALRISVHANCRVRRVYFSDRLYHNWQLPRGFRIEDQGTSQYVSSSPAATSFVISAQSSVEASAAPGPE